MDLNKRDNNLCYNYLENTPRYKNIKEIKKKENEKILSMNLSIGDIKNIISKQKLFNLKEIEELCNHFDLDPKIREDVYNAVINNQDSNIGNHISNIN